MRYNRVTLILTTRIMRKSTARKWKDIPILGIGVILLLINHIFDPHEYQLIIMNIYAVWAMIMLHLEKKED